MAVRKQDWLYISIDLAVDFFCASQELDRISGFFGKLDISAANAGDALCRDVFRRSIPLGQ